MSSSPQNVQNISNHLLSDLDGALLTDVASGRHQAVQAISPQVGTIVYKQIRAMGKYPFIFTCGARGD